MRPPTPKRRRRWNKTEKPRWPTPRGSGKSCIAWQLVADHPQASFVWLVYGQARLPLRKADVSRYNDGVLPPNVVFCDCTALAEATAEQWIRLAAKKPDYIIFDCSCSARKRSCWA